MGTPLLRHTEEDVGEGGRMDGYCNDGGGGGGGNGNDKDALGGIAGSIL